MNNKKESLKISIVEGVFASAMAGFTQDYFAPFLLVLGGTVRQIGLLSAIPNLAASLIQLKSAALIAWLGSRKKMINIFVFLQAIALIPMVILAFVGAREPGLFIVLVVLFTCFGALSSPAWGSLISDLVEPAERGQYFGLRNKILGFAAVLASFTAGFILYTSKKANISRAFALIFTAAFIWRIISWRKMKRIYEPILHDDGKNHFTLIQFLKHLKKSNFAKFVVFSSLMSFSVNIASPFFAVLMLRDLKFNYLLYTIVTLAATLTIYVAIARWGRHADKTGNLKVIRITSPLIGFIPLLWLINQSPVYLICAQIFSGFLWAGFNICTTNFIYDAVSPAKRTRCIAYFNTLNGMALCCGAVLGGFLLPFLPPVRGYKILTLFIVSSMLRIIVGLFLPRQLKEVRAVESIKSDQVFFSMIGIKPLLGVERKTIRY
ncbi:MAG: MFS transporter [Candidatus Omnitrophota bacterium]